MSDGKCPGVRFNPPKSETVTTAFHFQSSDCKSKPKKINITKLTKQAKANVAYEDKLYQKRLKAGKLFTSIYLFYLLDW